MTETVSDLSTQTNNLSKTCQYSPHMTNRALSFFRNKSCYNEVYQSGLICLPYPRALSYITRNVQRKEGEDHIIYLSCQDEIKLSKSCLTK